MYARSCGGESSTADAEEALAGEPERRDDKAGDPPAPLRTRGDVPALDGAEVAVELPRDPVGDSLGLEPILESMATGAVHKTALWETMRPS